MSNYFNLFQNSAIQKETYSDSSYDSSNKEYLVNSSRVCYNLDEKNGFYESECRKYTGINLKVPDALEFMEDYVIYVEFKNTTKVGRSVAAAFDKFSSSIYLNILFEYPQNMSTKKMMMLLVVPKDIHSICTDRHHIGTNTLSKSRIEGAKRNFREKFGSGHVNTEELYKHINSSNYIYKVTKNVDHMNLFVTTSDVFELMFK